LIVELELELEVVGVWIKKKERGREKGGEGSYIETIKKIKK
jgi:hypothetical protein